MIFAADIDRARAIIRTVCRRLEGHGNHATHEELSEALAILDGEKPLKPVVIGGDTFNGEGK